MIISNDERGLNSDLDYVNALICTSAKVNREPKKKEVILNATDDLDLKPTVRCDVIRAGSAAAARFFPQMLGVPKST